MSMLLIATLSCCFAPLQTNVADDHVAIQGEWEVLEISDGGRKQDPKGATMKFAGDVATYIRGSRRDSTKFRLDPTKSPKWIDMTETAKSRTSPGIYDLSGDDLRVCLNGEVEHNNQRPGKFGSEEGAPHDTLIILRRIKN